MVATDVLRNVAIGQARSPSGVAARSLLLLPRAVRMREERVPIYSYPAKYRWLFTTCLIVGTLVIWGIRIGLEWAVETTDTWKATLDAILNALPMSGFTGVIIGIITVEVTIVVGELLTIRRKKLEARAENAEARAEKAEARLKDAEAENPELRAQLKRNGPADDARR